uniref:Uncharacterized protein n=1 Tax=Pfiesteria piscicida TaxID=71001 RepID=A3E3Q7_PFIPI|nr:unknown [Pfiesteria piscicida]
MSGKLKGIFDAFDHGADTLMMGFTSSRQSVSSPGTIGLFFISHTQVQLLALSWSR